MLTVLDGLSLLRICILSGTRSALPDKPEEQPPRVEPNDPAVAVPSRPLPRIPALPVG